jgi:Glycosyltransferases, probably involved in cell wall biogenesis
MYQKKDPNLPTVTVVTPAYNQANYLRDTIESVLSQDYPNIEYIVLDDGSTDDTPRILAEYGDRFDWESHPNMGQTPTINKGWAKTSGEIITWLNSDDTYLPNAVGRAVEYFAEHPTTGVVYGDSITTNADGTAFGTSRSAAVFDYTHFVLNCDNTVTQPSSFIRREVINKVGYLDSSFYYFMDWDLWLRAGLYFGIDHISELLATYRFHAESKTVAQSKKAAPELEYMYRKYFSREDLPDHILRGKKKALMNMYFLTASYFLKGGDRKSAAQVANKALRQNPSGILSIRNIRKYAYSLTASVETGI